MLVPSTGYIVDDVLPTFHDKYNDDEDISKISSTLSKDKIGFVDLRERFKSEYKTAVRFTTKPTTIGQQRVLTRATKSFARHSALLRLMIQP